MEHNKTNDEFDLLSPPPVTRELAVERAKGLNSDSYEDDPVITEFMNSITVYDGPEFDSIVRRVESLGSVAVHRSSNVSHKLLQNPAVATTKNKTGFNVFTPQSKVGKSLVDLRNIVTSLDPNRSNPKGYRKFFKLVPFFDDAEKFVQKYRNAEDQLDDIMNSLNNGQDELRKNNASIEVEQSNLWESLDSLSKHVLRAEMLDKKICEKIAELNRSGEDTGRLSSDLLFAVRQRHQDLLTQKAVAVQGYMALGLIRKNNEELIKGVDRAQQTTLSALKTAVIVSQALNQQEQVLNQVESVDKTTSALLESTSQRLHDQTVRIHEKSINATISPDSLRKAFDNVYKTMDAIDDFRSKANDSMNTTILQLETELSRVEGEVFKRGIEGLK